MSNIRNSKVMRMISILAVILLCICFTAANTVLSFAGNYKYEVTVSAGQLGTVTGDSKVTMSYGQRWDPNDYSVKVKNKKYYFKGFAKSGHEEIVGSTEITEDTDFVAVYGIKGKMVSYEVSYQEKGTKKELAKSRTLYGNPGDKPVAAAVHVEGYIPEAYNVTKTLSEDASKNRLTFFYTKAESGQNASDGNENGQSDGSGNDNGEGNGDADGNGSGGSGNGDADGNGSGGTGNGDAGADASGNGTGTGAGNGSGTAAGSSDGQTIADADSPTAEPKDTMDLDEGDVPLDDDGKDAAEETGNSSLVKWAIICIVIAVIAMIAALVIRSKRRNV